MRSLNVLRTHSFFLADVWGCGVAHRAGGFLINSCHAYNKRYMAANFCSPRAVSGIPFTHPSSPRFVCVIAKHIHLPRVLCTLLPNTKWLENSPVASSGNGKRATEWASVRVGRVSLAQGQQRNVIGWKVVAG